MKKTLTLRLIIIISMLFFLANAKALNFITPVSATSANNLSLGDSTMLIESATDTDYLAPSPEGGGAGTATWIDQNTNTWTFNLDSAHTLSEAYIWDYYSHSPTGWQLTFFDGDDASGTNLGSHIFDIAPICSGSCSLLHTISFADITNVRSVTLTNTNTSAASGVGLAEVHFGGISLEYNLLGSVNVDNIFAAYISTDNAVRGTLLTSGTDWQTTYELLSSLAFEQEYYLHIEATDAGGVAGFLGDFEISGTGHTFSNGLTELNTNTTDWVVSTTGWSNYLPVTAYGENGVAPWGNLSAVEASAQWIWSADNATDNVNYFSSTIIPIIPDDDYLLVVTPISVTSLNSPGVGNATDLIESANDTRYLAPNPAGGGGGTSTWTGSAVNTWTFNFDAAYKLHSAYIWDYYTHSPTGWQLNFFDGDDASGTHLGSHSFDITPVCGGSCSTLHTTEFADVSNVRSVTLTSTNTSAAGGVGLAEVHFGGETLASNFSGSVSVDNVFEAYISVDDSEQGVLLATGTDWETTYDLAITLAAGQDYYLHIKATDIGGAAGFLGDFTIVGTGHSFSNNLTKLTTNTTDWLVSTTGWNNYQPTSAYGVNGAEPWGTQASIDADAEWIWSSDNETDNVNYFTTKITGISATAHYRLEETTWTGSAADVVDDSSNAYNGTALGSLSSILPTNPISCRAMNVPVNTSADVQDGLDTSINVSDDIGDAGTISFWYKSNTSWQGAEHRTLFDATNNNNNQTQFNLTIRDNSALRFRVKNGNGQNVSNFLTSAINVPAQVWTFITVTWDTASGFYNIYVKSEDGSIDFSESKNDPTPSSIALNLHSLYIGDSRSSSGNMRGASAHSADGEYDEIRIFRNALNESQILSLYADTTVCEESIVNHYEIIHDGKGLTCDTESVTINACMDSDCVLKSSDVVTLDFQVTNTDTGTATITNSVTFTGTTDIDFNHTVIDTLALSVTNATVTATDPMVCNNGVDASCNMTFSDAELRFLYVTDDTLDPNEISNQISGPVFDGRLTLQALKDDNGDCNAFFNGNKDIVLSQENVNPSGNGGLSFSIDGNDIVKHSNLDLDTPGTTLYFDTDGIATILTPRYYDAGQIILHANYDDDVVTLSGSSLPFWVSPATLVVSAELEGEGASENVILNGATATAEPTHAAGQEFILSVSARNSIGGITQNYSPGKGKMQFKLMRVAPVASGVNGRLTYATGIESYLATSRSPVFENVTLSSFSTGESTFTEAHYSEVGLLNLDVQDSEYGFAENVISATAINIGRFIPHHLTQTIEEAGYLVATCKKGMIYAFSDFAYSGQMGEDEDNASKGAISYLSQPILEITAYNKQDGITQNYIDDYMKLSASNIKVTPPTLDTTPEGVVLPLTANMNIGTLSHNDLTVLPDEDPLDQGVLHYQFSADDNFFYNRSANALVEPFFATMDFSIGTSEEGDNVSITPAVVASLEGVEIRFGRLLLKNSFGSEISNLSQQMQVEHFDGTGYVVSSDNDCASYDATELSLSNINLDPALTDAVGGTGFFIAGKTQAIKLPAPGAGNTGELNVLYNTFDWLKYDWDGDGTHDNNPPAVATFGVFRGNDRIIHWREVFQ